MQVVLGFVAPLHGSQCNDRTICAIEGRTVCRGLYVPSLRSSHSVWLRFILVPHMTLNCNNPGVLRWCGVQASVCCVLEMAYGNAPTMRDNYWPCSWPKRGHGMWVCRRSPQRRNHVWNEYRWLQQLHVTILTLMLPSTVIITRRISPLTGWH